MARVLVEAEKKAKSMLALMHFKTKNIYLGAEDSKKYRERTRTMALGP